MNREDCTCLASNPITTTEWIATMVLLMTIPVFVLGLASGGHDIFQINYWFFGNLSLIVFLLIVTGLHYTFKRPFLPLVFGCHQKIERTLLIFGKALPLCARCTGIYVGALMSLLITRWNFLPWYVIVLFAIPLFVDGIIQKYKNLKSNNIRRFLTGLLFSTPFVYLFSLTQTGITYLYQELTRWILSLI
ncbi:MAG: DUF2085 domain-containing protein [Bacilli bacterium]|nr:DUF2085 domain-containing protein [Bacilli bacterium]